MMETIADTTHPDENELVALALGEPAQALASHCAECPACARFVKELRMARRDIDAVEEEDVPRRLGEKVRARHVSLMRGPLLAFWGRFAEWWRSPVVIAVALILFVLFAYILFVFVL